MQVEIGSLEELQRKGVLTGKAGSQPVCAFWHDGRAYAIDDRCPHLGFPLHRGTVENGLVTCHWHHARFDLCSGGTLDPFADDVRAYPVSTDGGRVVVTVEGGGGSLDHLHQRLDEGLEQGLTLVIAKAVLGLLEAGETAAGIVRRGLDFGCRYRSAGWGAGLTVLTAMANVLPQLDPAERPLALVHGLTFVSRDTRGRSPRFPLTPLGTDGVPADRLGAWYRRFVETRSADAAERTLATAVAAGLDEPAVAAVMTAAVTDHVFIDEGHTLDFTNKAFEVLGHVGWGSAGQVLPTLTMQTAGARRHEEEGPWRHPHDLAGLVTAAAERLPSLLLRATGRLGDDEVSKLGWAILDEDPEAVVAAIDGAIVGGATGEQLGRAVALAAALRIARFPTSNDHGDWDVVHHGFTFANALHQCLARATTPELLRGVYHAAMKVFLDRFLNVPAARPPATTTAGLDELQRCWDEQGRVEEAGAIVSSHIRRGDDRATAVAALGRALLAEDAEFHWFQTYEAAVRQAAAWPDGSEEGGLILAGAARFLAAHTPTRRELPQVVRIATRLRRGEALFEDEEPSPST